MLSFRLKSGQGEQKVISSPDELRSVQLIIDPVERIIQETTFMETHRLTDRELLRLYTLLDLIKHKQGVNSDPVKISKVYSHISAVYSSRGGLLYFFNDDGFSDSLVGKIKDVFFFRDKVDIPAGKKPLIEIFRKDFEDAIGRIRKPGDKEKAQELLENGDFLDVYSKFWDSIITIYTRFQNDLVYNFLLNVFRKYALF